jgi:uncharacterized protein (DUF433 family)
MDDVVTQHIEITPGIAGGKPRIAGHRITVQSVVIRHERIGVSADEIASDLGVSLADVYAALAYYYDHRQEIDKSILSDESYAAELRTRIPSKLSKKISG